MPAQTAWFLNSIQGDRLYAAYHLIALRGLRRGEAAGLRWCDVDLEGATAVISQQLQQYGGHLAACPPKTGSKAAEDTATLVIQAATASREPGDPGADPESGHCAGASGPRFWATPALLIPPGRSDIQPDASVQPGPAAGSGNGAIWVPDSQNRPYPDQRLPIPGQPGVRLYRHEPRSGWVGRVGLEPTTGGL